MVIIKCLKNFNYVYFSCFPAAIMNTWREAFDDAVEKFGGWPSLEKADNKPRIPIEQMYGVMVAKFKSDSLFKTTVQPDDKNSKQNVLLVRSIYSYNVSDNC